MDKLGQLDSIQCYVYLLTYSNAQYVDYLRLLPFWIFCADKYFNCICISVIKLDIIPRLWFYNCSKQLYNNTSDNIIYIILDNQPIVARNKLLVWIHS